MIITSRYEFIHHPIGSMEDRGIGELRFSARFRRTLEGIIQVSKDSSDFYKYSSEDETIAVKSIYGWLIYFYKNKVTGDVSISIID